MFSYVLLGSNDIARSKRFYDALFAATGGQPGVIDSRGRVVYVKDHNRLVLTMPIDGGPATSANGATIGFAMATPEQGEAWHKAGIENGGESIEDPPGERKTPNGSMYLAYLRDPDGNKLCALHRLAA